MGAGFVKVFLDKRENFNQTSAKREEEMGKPEGVREYDDISYVEDGQAVHKMDIFQPLDCEGKKWPVIINVHGGGMILGNKEFNRHFCAEVCKRGFLVFSIEYSLVPEIQVYTQFEDLTLAMNKIKEMLPQYGGDIEHVYLVGDSGGAYITTYTVAMQKSEALAKAAGIIPAELKVNALGLISGMFYTTKFDEIGLFMPKFLYGEKYKKSAFAPYVNPEHPEIVTSLPPVLLVSSNNDNLKHYTLNFEKALSKHDAEHELLYFGQKNEKLTHAFSVFEPYLEESQETIDKLVQFLQKY